MCSELSLCVRLWRVKPSLYNAQCPIAPCALFWLLPMFLCHYWLMEKQQSSHDCTSGSKQLYAYSSFWKNVTYGEHCLSSVFKRGSFCFTPFPLWIQLFSDNGTYACSKKIISIPIMWVRQEYEYYISFVFMGVFVCMSVCLVGFVQVKTFNWKPLP